MSLAYSLVLLFALCTGTLIQGNSWPECDAGDVRLYNNVSQNNSLQGRVHVCSLQRIWRRVCNSDTFDQQDMNVICRQLGFLPYGTPGVLTDDYDTSDGFLLNEVNCRRDEQRLADCNYTTSTTCSTNSSPVVRCYEAFPPRELIAESSQTSTLLSWREPLGNDLVNESVTEYIVECSAQDLHHVVSLAVANSSTHTTVNGLYPNTTYNCCVTAMFETYSTKNRTITETMDVSNCEDHSTLSSRNYTEPTCATEKCIAELCCITSSTQEQPTILSSCNAVGGVLGFITVVLIVALIITLGILVYVIFRTKNTTSWKFPLRNPDHTMENPTYSGTELPHKNTNQRDGGHSPTITQYGSLGPAYETLDSVHVPPPRRQGDQNTNTNTNQTPLAEHYEFAEINQDTDATSGNGMKYKQLKLKEDTPNQGTAEYETLNRDPCSKMSQATKADRKVANDDTKAKRKSSSSQTKTVNEEDHTYSSLGEASSSMVAQKRIQLQTVTLEEVDRTYSSLSEASRPKGRMNDIPGEENGYSHLAH